MKLSGELFKVPARSIQPPSRAAHGEYCWTKVNAKGRGLDGSSGNICVQGPIGFDAKEVWCGGTRRKLSACHSGLPDSGASMGSAGLSFLGIAGM